MLFVLVLLFLLELNCQLVHSRSITINGDGNSSTSCCVNGSCDCSSLYIALQYISNDTIINITSSRVSLSDNVTISRHDVIEIIGNGDTVVDCNHTGYVSFLNCSNVSISGIIWDHCGGVYSPGAISVTFSKKFSVSSCKVQNSLTYGITIQATLGVIAITNTEILNNSVKNTASGFHLQQTTEDSGSELELKIINCSLKFNGLKSLSNGSGIKIETTGKTSSLNVSIENSVISNNQGAYGGGIFVHAISVNNLTVKITNVTFIDNHAYYDSIYYFTPGDGKNASFIITGGSKIIGDSRNYLHLAAYMALFLVEDLTVHTDDDYMDFLIETYSKNLTINISEASLDNTRVTLRIQNYPESCILNFNEVIANNNSSLDIDGSESHGFQCSIANCHFVNNSDDIAVVNIFNKSPHTNGDYDTDVPAIIEIINSTFANISHANSVVRLVYDNENSRSLGKVHLSSTNFSDNIDNDNTLYLFYCNLTMSNKVIFRNNTAIRGAGIYFANLSTATLDLHAEMEFIDNTAALGGGAIYAEFPLTLNFCYLWLLFHITGEYTATFTNNHANAAGNSIFFSIPIEVAHCIDRNSSSSSSLIYVPSQFNFSGNNEISTSPYNLQLGPPAVCNSSCSDGGIYQVKDIMLGEDFAIVMKMMDYYGNTAEPTLFQIRCSENCQNYYFTDSNKFEYKFIETNKTINTSIFGNEVKTDSIIGLEITSVLGTINSDVRSIKVKVEVTIIPCQIGYIYNSNKKACQCHKIDDIVECELDSIKIKRGYWYGKIGDRVVVGSCPNNYCNYASSCKSSEKFCDLSKFSYDQCNKHRTGPACGKCQEHYNLAYDSADCVPDSHCSGWWTAGLIILTLLYWVIVSLTIIFMMYFITAPTMLGYVYGIIYFYSVVDLFISNELPISKGLVQFIEILSGLVNLTPRFLGSLCLVKGLSGIDQQFIHYVHPLAIALLLFIIPKLIKCSGRLNDILVYRVGTARPLCLLLLLCYTSVSSTSLHLLWPLTFKGTDTTYTYFSPDIKYFSGRHIIYGSLAILVTIVIVLLPIFLLLQPQLRRIQRTQFIKIMPILDHIQQCYKNEYHWVAALYLISRLLIFVTVGLNTYEYITSYFVLQFLCFVVAVVHIMLRPYKNDAVNSLDHIILLIAVMVVSLNTNSLFISLSTDTAVNDFIVAMFVLLPLITFIGFLLLTIKEKFSRRSEYTELDATGSYDGHAQVVS